MCGQKPLHVKTQLSFFGQVKEFFTGIFDTANWPPRWHCGTWTDFHGWLYILSDLAIFTAYFAIPLLLFRIISKRKDIPFPKIIWLFIAFILLCGTTHLLDAIIFWWPAYRLSALVRFFTGVISIFTVFALYKITPVIYKLRTVEQLEAEIEDRKRAEAESKHNKLMQLAAEELMQKKDEFMSFASHELKTPITSVKACLQVLQKVVKQNDTLDDVAPFVERASKQVNKLTDIINELMDVTRIQAGKLELNRSDFNLMGLVQESIDQCRLGEERRTVTITGDKEVVINGDYTRLEQVLTNFLTNAFKYSAEGEEVDISFYSNPGGGTRVAVTDKGIGIANDKVAQIFDRFYRVENTSQKYSGMGLGLYISAEIIRQHGGQIGVDSTLGEGSTFWFIV